MTEETDQTEQTEESAEAVSEQEAQDSQEEQQQEDAKMVPLAALQAERKKRQELEAWKLHQEQQAQKEEVDPEALVENQHLQNATAATKREILETLYQDMNPKAVQEINQYLKPILEKKPWLAGSVDTALNRYARAYEIVTDYKHLVAAPSKGAVASDGRRMVENAKKPGSPVAAGKSAQPSGLDYLKSIQGKPEFREYREKLRRGEI